MSLIIPLRLATDKRYTASTTIPICTLRTAKSGTVTAQKRADRSIDLTLAPSPVIGDLQVNAAYDLFCYRYVYADVWGVAVNGDGNGTFYDKWPETSRIRLGTIQTSAPEGEMIVTGDTVFNIPPGKDSTKGDLGVLFFVLINQANVDEQHWSQWVTTDKM